MHEPETVAAFIERIVAHIPNAAERDHLRRELWTHFEEAGTSPEALHHALSRFGAEALVTESLRRVYRFDYALAYLAKIAASIAASVAAALLIQVLVNLRAEMQADVWRLAPGFSRGAGVSVAVVFGLVTAWEVCRPPFNRSRAAVALGAYAAVSVLAQRLFTIGSGPFVAATMFVLLGDACSRLTARPTRLLLVFGTFAAALYVDHFVLLVAFGLSCALAASAVIVAVWSSTVLILARVDHAFLSLFSPANCGMA